MNAAPRIVIVDYGVGNLWSLLKAVRLFAPQALISDEQETIERADALILPGVGAFKSGMEGLAVRSLTDSVRRFGTSGKPLLGICLGAQLLLSEGREFGVHEGLGIIEGTVEHFSELPKEYKIPNMGWRPISVRRPDRLFDSIGDASMYFVHSYILKPKHADHVLATSTYGPETFCAVMKKGAAYGVQFHPEKSGEKGIQLIKNFIAHL